MGPEHTPHRRPGVSVTYCNTELEATNLSPYTFLEKSNKKEIFRSFLLGCEHYKVGPNLSGVQLPWEIVPAYHLPWISRRAVLEQERSYR